MELQNKPPAHIELSLPTSFLERHLSQPKACGILSRPCNVFGGHVVMEIIVQLSM